MLDQARYWLIDNTNKCIQCLGWCLRCCVVGHRCQQQLFLSFATNFSIARLPSARARSCEHNPDHIISPNYERICYYFAVTADLELVSTYHYLVSYLLAGWMRLVGSGPTMASPQSACASLNINFGTIDFVFCGLDAAVSLVASSCDGSPYICIWDQYTSARSRESTNGYAWKFQYPCRIWQVCCWLWTGIKRHISRYPTWSSCLLQRKFRGRYYALLECTTFWLLKLL